VSWKDDNRAWLETARSRWTPRTAEPLRLRVWFSSPVAFDGHDPPRIEGLLQYIVVCREARGIPSDVFANFPRRELADVPIPIQDVEIAGRPIACASIGWPPVIAIEGVRWRRKRARHEAYGGIDRLAISGGWAKSINIPVATLVTPWLDFYVRGDRELIADLCRDLPAVGRDGPRGLGTVLGVELHEDPDDRSLLFCSTPQRSIPLVSDGGAYDPRSYADGTWDERETTTRAPYWVPTTRTLCAVPVLRIGEPQAWEDAA
jgi:hypothetical protein